MSLKLKNVDIYKYYCLCAVYAIERTGTKFSLNDLLTGTEEFTEWKNLETGDIVCWNVGRRDYDTYPTEIEDDVLLSPWIVVERHFGVVEEGNKVSDLTFTKDEDGSEHPILRFRKTEKLRNPDYIFRNSVSEEKS